MKLMLATTIALFLNGMALAGTSPFGMPINATLDQLKKMGAIETSSKVAGLYKMTNVPMPNSSFDFYVVGYSQIYGVCYIKAVGKEITTDGYGSNLKSAFQLMRNALKTKYGSDENFDFLHSKSIWDQSGDWMMGLKLDQRSLASYWESESKAVIPVDLGAISLEAHALSSSSGYLTVIYSAKNEKACIDDKNKPSTNGL